MVLNITLSRNTAYRNICEIINNVYAVNEDCFPLFVMDLDCSMCGTQPLKLTDYIDELSNV